MPLETFEYFLRLPFDIRREIYMLATPPRVVHVKELNDKEQFDVRFNKRINLRVSPDLAYFAPNWRCEIPGPAKQRTLESVGVTSKYKPYQPWEPSPSTPEIPLHWLQDQPMVAAQIMRENYLYSETPVPSLLHMSYESRMVLVRWGYTLAFATRRCAGGTWFNFDRDVLFVSKPSRDDYEDDGLLTESPWRILGQFHSNDLKRVRTLALGDSAPTLFPWTRYAYYDILVSTIQLFPELRELQIVQWEQEALFRWRNFGSNVTSKHPWYIDQGSDIAGELYSLPVEDIDALIKLISFKDGRRDDVPAAGVMGEKLKEHTKRTDIKLGFFEYQEQFLEQKLKEESDKMRNRSKREEPGLSTFSWQVPRIKAVHVIPPSMAILVKEERQIAWEKFLKMKQNWQSTGHRLAQSFYTPEEVTNPWYNEDGTMDDDWDLGPFSELHMYGDGLNIVHRRAREWWAENGSISPPSNEALF
ncbi:hypothetical protein BJX70DRAFT_355380 [Aspergillus crustosus]